MRSRYYYADRRRMCGVRYDVIRVTSNRYIQELAYFGTFATQAIKITICRQL
jgi:hypothetical protein